MAINVKHGVAAGPAAAAAFGGAQNRSRQQAALGGAQAASIADRQADAQKAALERLAAGAEIQAETAETAAAQSADARDLFDYSRTVGRSPMGAVAGVGGPGGRDDLELSLTTRQRAELDRLADSEAQALASPDYTEDEKRELREKFAQRRAGIAPVARPRAPTPAELFKASTYVDPKTGRVYPIDPQGKVDRALYEPPERLPTVQDRIKAVQAATALAEDPVTGKVDPAKFAEAMQRMLAGETGAGLEEGSEIPGDEDPEAAVAPAGADAPAVAGAPVSAGTPAAPLSPEARIAQIESSPPTITTNLDPAEVNDLPTMFLQLQDARALQAADHEEADMALRAIDKGFGHQGPNAPGLKKMRDNVAKFYEYRRAETSDRIAKLEARAEQLSAEKIVLEARGGVRPGQRLGTRSGPMTPPPGQATPPTNRTFGNEGTVLTGAVTADGMPVRDVTPAAIERARALGQQDRKEAKAARERAALAGRARRGATQPDADDLAYKADIARLSRRGARRADVRRAEE